MQWAKVRHMKKVSLLICFSFFLFQCNSEAERFILSEALSESVATTAATSPCVDDCLNVNESAPETEVAETNPDTGMEAVNVDLDDVEVSDVLVGEISPSGSADDDVDSESGADLDGAEGATEVTEPTITLVPKPNIADRYGSFQVAGEAEETDTDADGILDEIDNCIDVANASQTNQNEGYDDVGDVCDYINDADEDGLADAIDVQVTVFNSWHNVDPTVVMDTFYKYKDETTFTFVGGKRIVKQGVGSTKIIDFETASDIRVKGVVDASLALSTINDCTADDGDQVGICIVSVVSGIRIQDMGVDVLIEKNQTAEKISTPKINIDKSQFGIEKIIGQ